ncbi:MAG: putative xylanase/chitin deacetylase [Blastococcus sp.]|nr:putative xylanase/chitin deacetylase [Blastococcus sp.]
MTDRDATRPADPIQWPEGMRAAAVLGFDMDAEAVVLTVDPANAGRLSVMSHQAYGPVTGMPRILKMLERRNVRATFFCPGYTAERYPDLVRRVRDGGHEIAHHGYLHEAVQGMDQHEEADILDRGLEALERITGQRPVGYRAPMWETTYSTARLLLDRGFLYDSSLMDCDVPYELAESTEQDARSIVEIPVSWSLDDWEQYAYLPDVFGSGLIEDPAKSLSMWTGELTESHAEGACFTLTSHPFLTGRLGRLAALDRLIGLMTDWSDLWIATAAQVAAHTRSLGLTPRVFPQPKV